jgi:DNA-binding transcriptional ArsR family regulator
MPTAKLRDAGLVEVRSEAQRRVYRVCAEPLRAVDEWLLPYRRLWASRLNALEGHLETMQDDDPDDRR